MRSHRLRALPFAIPVQTFLYLPETSLLCNKLNFQILRGLGMLSCDHVMASCSWLNYDHEVMGSNRIIKSIMSVFFDNINQCLYLLYQSGRQITFSPTSVFSKSEVQQLLSSFPHLYGDHYPLHCLGPCCRYDLSHCFSLFRWSLVKRYLSHKSPTILTLL